MSPQQRTLSSSCEGHGVSGAAVGLQSFAKSSLMGGAVTYILLISCACKPLSSVGRLLLPMLCLGAHPLTVCKAEV